MITGFKMGYGAMIILKLYLLILVYYNFIIGKHSLSI